MLAPDAPPFLAPEKLGHPSRSILSPFERKKVKFFVRLINNPSSRSNYGIDINFHSRMIVCMYIYIYTEFSQLLQRWRNCNFKEERKKCNIYIRTHLNFERVKVRGINRFLR